MIAKVRSGMAVYAAAGLGPKNLLRCRIMRRLWDKYKPDSTRAPRLVDLGCWNGAFLECFSTQAETCYAVDTYLQGLIDCKKRGFSPVNADLTASFPFQDGSFDAVIAGEVIEHVADTDAFLLETFRILKSGGVLLLSTPNICSLRNRVRLLLNRYPFGVEWKQIDGHLKTYNTSVLKAQLRRHGFEVLYLKGLNILPSRMFHLLPPLRWISNFLSNLLPSLCTDLIVSARKPLPTSHSTAENFLNRLT